MIEFAIGSGVLLAAFSGTFQFGYTFLQYNNLENAVARGARYASLVPYDSPQRNPDRSVQDSGTEHGLVRDPDRGHHAGSGGLGGYECQFDRDVCEWDTQYHDGLH